MAPDEPLGLYVGGSFTTAGTGGGAVNNVNNIALRHHRSVGHAPPRSRGRAWARPVTAAATGIAGIDEVLAIQAYQPPAAGGGMQPAPRLYVGGRGRHQRILRFWDPTATAGNAWTVSASGGTGPVFAMDVWTPPTSINPQMNQFLVIGGGNNAAGYLRVSLGGATSSFLPAVDGASATSLFVWTTSRASPPTRSNSSSAARSRPSRTSTATCSRPTASPVSTGGLPADRRRRLEHPQAAA